MPKKTPHPRSLSGLGQEHELGDHVFWGSVMKSSIKYK